jgi:hypothetical protein
MANSKQPHLCRPTISRAALAHLRKLEVKAQLDGSIQNLADAQLFGAYRDLVARGGGADAFALAFHADGDENLARSVIALSGCHAASDFMALEP